MKKNAVLIAGIVLSKICFAQDPHFSQYYGSPLTVNPANGGCFTGDSRITGLYRQQWPEYGDPFVTGTVSFEFKPGKYKNEETIDRLAIGGMLMFDRTPDAVLKSQYAYILLAYHKALDENGNHRIGMGFMGGYQEKRIDASGLTFADQFGSGGFQQTGGEAIDAKKISVFDVHAGLLYSYQDETKMFYAGGSVYHITGPKNYFLQNNTVLKTIPRRWNLNAGMNVTLNTVQFATSLLFMRQSGVDEFIFGGAVGIPLPVVHNSFLYLGSWYRLNEAVIPTINLQWQNLNLGFSYDAFIDHRTATKPNSMEISVALRTTRLKEYKVGCFSF